MVAWVVFCDQRDFPDRYVAQLVMAAMPQPYLLVGDSLLELRAQLPPGLVRKPRGRADRSDVVETWFEP